MPGSLLDLAAQLVRIPSVTTDGTREAACFLRDAVLSRADVEVRLDSGPEPAQVNLLAIRPGGPAPAILLASHLDTVPPGDPELWTVCGKDPFAATLRDGYLYGLGSADAKLDALVKALALSRFRGRRLRRPVVFAATFGEERGLLGARQLLERLPLRPIAAWVGEPTALEVVTRHKGLAVFRVAAREPAPIERPEAAQRLVVLGRSAHSSTPALGENAAERALQWVAAHGLRLARVDAGDAANKVPARAEIAVVGESLPPPPPRARIEGLLRAPPLSARLQSFLLEAMSLLARIRETPSSRDESFDPPHRTLNIGRVAAFAGKVEILLDVRSLPGESSVEVVDRLERWLGVQRNAGLEAELVVERDNPALDLAPESPPVVWSVSALAALGRSTTLRTKAGCTEAGLYARSGIPAVVFGPGVSAGNVHAPNERVSLADLERALEFYERLLEEVCAE